MATYLLHFACRLLVTVPPWKEGFIVTQLDQLLPNCVSLSQRIGYVVNILSILIPENWLCS